MKSGDKQYGIPFTEFTGTKANIEATASPAVGMVAVATDNAAAPFGTYNGTAWVWTTSNATHTGEVTGATALTVDKTAITGKTLVTAVGTDYVLISDTSDSGNLKQALASDLAGSAVSDAAYGAGWDGVTTIAPSKNAVYDKIEAMPNVTLSTDADTFLSLSTQQIGLDTQTANKVFASPTSGGAAVPAFRALVAADIPALSAYLQLIGGTMLGDLFFPQSGFIMASNTYTWRVQVNDSGTLITSLYVSEPYLNFSNADDSMYIGVI